MTIGNQIRHEITAIIHLDLNNVLTESKYYSMSLSTILTNRPINLARKVKRNKIFINFV